jgi:tRNA pseudouridine32 synthase/23S rRNA pseudouridine746 synthase/23S rRNA pseudouridine1911/1915/1917 synthase
MKPDALLSRLLYKDSLMLVIDKPAGLPVHAGPKGGENLEQYFPALRFGLPRSPALAHRLDRDTSGCLVLGRHRKALAKLGRLFSSGRVSKTYWAIVAGAPPEAEGRISFPLMKRSTERGWWMKTSPEGLPTITDYKLMGRSDGYSWLELKPQTGRTHQIRVHCAALGCPILGDPIYGGEITESETRPLHLHARAVSVPLYPSREPIAATAPVPEHMRALLEACGFREDAAVLEAASAARESA